MTVNLLEFETLVPADLQNYFNCVHYQGRLRSITVYGSPRPPAGPFSEALLDVEMIAGLAPAADIITYQVDPNDAQSYDDLWTHYNDGLQRMIDDNTHNGGSGGVVSISLGVTEGLLTRSVIASIDQSLEILTRVEHMTVFVASGDCAAFDLASEGGSYGRLSVGYPASDPWAVGVGGTMVGINRATRSVESLAETVWSDGSNRSACNNNWGSGGGLSQVFRRPAWQEGPGVHNRYSNGSRQLPDVSAYAFVLMYYRGGHWRGAEGTSAATPIWASGMLLANEGLIRRVHGFFVGPQLFYAVAQFAASHHLEAYHDITAGNNLYYSTTGGYDLATGFGSPNLPAFYSVLVAIAGSRS